MTMMTAGKQETITIYGLAKSYVAKANGDTAAASAAMIADITRNKDLLSAIVDDAISIASKQYVNSVIGNKRTAVMTSAEDNVVPMTGMSSASATAFAASMKHCLMDFPLRGGLRLRDATAEDIAAQADYYERSSATDALRGRWLRLVEAKVPAGKKAGKVLTETKLQKLYEDAKHG